MNTQQQQTLSSIKEEIQYVRENLPLQTELISANTNFVTAICEKTPSRSIKVTLTIPSEYPHRPLIVAVDTQQNGKMSIPPGLKKKLEKELTKSPEDILPGTFGQIHAVLARLQLFVDTNRFVPCWKELKQSMDLISSLTTKKSGLYTMSILSETKGTMKVQFERNSSYKYAYKITIDEGYPTTLSIHDWGKSSYIQTISSGTNIPNELFTFLTNQAQLFVRLLQDGMSEKEARSHVVQQTNNSNTGVGVMIKVDGHEVPKYDGSNPQPSLLPLIRYLTETIPSLSDQICPKCDELVFPSDSQSLKSSYIPVVNKSKQTRKKKQQCPMQSHCGCWYHYGCLQQILLEPPFGDICPNDGCGCEVGHKIFSDNIATRDQREINWQLEQSKQRELDDMDMMF